ncbi:hypothetical protein [Pedococcus sp. 5OH_020]|nr:hypothetical protein [Pedococcus sp. 5OH_020]
MECLSASTSIWCQLAGLGEVRHDAPPQEQLQVQRPITVRRTTGW